MLRQGIKSHHTCTIAITCISPLLPGFKRKGVMEHKRSKRRQRDGIRYTEPVHLSYTTRMAFCTSHLTTDKPFVFHKWSQLYCTQIKIQQRSPNPFLPTPRVFPAPQKPKGELRWVINCSWHQALRQVLPNFSVWELQYFMYFCRQKGTSVLEMTTWLASFL